MCTMQVVLPNKNGTDTGTLGNKFPHHKLFASHPPCDSTTTKERIQESPPF